jgi:hypothetical protein
MKPKLYIETSIVSYLTALPNRDLVRAAHQQVTRDWWAAREQFELYISQFVIDEATAGDRSAAAQRLAALRDTTLLEATCRSHGVEPPTICTPIELVKE